MRPPFPLYLLLLFTLISCGNETPDNPPSTEKKVAPVKKKEEAKAPVKKDTFQVITNRDVKERLLKYGKNNPETRVKIVTDMGNIVIRLYKDTPLHRASFILMAKNGCFDNNIFTRVREDFMAQAGGSYDQKITEKRNSIAGYTIPAEMRPNHFHKRGAVGAARSYMNNPDKRSNPYAFYFVEGTVYNEITLNKYEEENQYRFPPAHRAYYLKNPGAAHIDGQHTVFGEIIEGYSIVPKITHVETDSRDWPVNDIFIKEVIVLD